MHIIIVGLKNTQSEAKYANYRVLSDLAPWILNPSDNNILLKNLKIALMFYSMSLLNSKATSLSNESKTASIIVAIYQNMINNNMWYVFKVCFLRTFLIQWYIIELWLMIRVNACKISQVWINSNLINVTVCMELFPSELCITITIKPEAVLFKTTILTWQWKMNLYFWYIYLLVRVLCEEYNNTDHTW